jgi:hypothetical protein
MDNEIWMIKKWRLDNNAYAWDKPSYRREGEVDWHPAHTALYEERYGIKCRIPYINEHYVGCGKEVFH